MAEGALGFTYGGGGYRGQGQEKYEFIRDDEIQEKNFSKGMGQTKEDVFEEKQKVGP